MIAMFTHKCLSVGCGRPWSATERDRACPFCGSDNILCWKAP